MLKRLKSRWSLQDGEPGPGKQDLEAADVVRGFKQLARLLRAQSLPLAPITPVRIVVAGDTLAALLLRTRSSTSAVDIIAQTGDDLRLVLAAKRAVASELRFSLNWISAQIMQDVDHDSRFNSLFDDSVAQGIVLFTSDSFIVHAVDLRFQLLAIINRLQLRQVIYDPAAGPQQHPGLSDGMATLHLIVQRQRRPVLLEDMRNWYEVGDNLEYMTVKMLATAYRDVYGTDGIRH